MMKRILHFLVLTVASAIPGIGMAASDNDYGIRIAGTIVSSSNASNVTNDYITQGKISYDYSTNTLTLSNVYIKSSNHNQILILSSAKDGMQVVVEGYNKIEKGDGVAFAIHKATGGTSYSHTYNVLIRGEGALVLEGGGTIATVDGANVSLGEDLYAYEKGPLDIYANAIYSSSGGGYLNVTKANLHLTGFLQGTIHGFKDVYMASSINAYDNLDQPTYSYDNENRTLVTSNGNKVTGNVYMGFKRYGLNICGKEVTSENYKNIKVETSDMGSEIIQYDPAIKVLYLNNVSKAVSIGITNASEQFHHTAIANQINGLTIKSSGMNFIASRGSSAIHSTGNLRFAGKGNLDIGVRVGDPYAIEMGGSANQLTFCGPLFVHVINGMVDCKGCKLVFDNANHSFESGIRNVGSWSADSTEIATPGVYWDSENNRLCKAGASSAYEGPLKLESVETYYGIKVCNKSVTDKNYRNFVAPFMESGTITYNPEDHVLTLTDVNIDTKNQEFWWSAFDFNYAYESLAICLKGNNVVKDDNICFYPPSGATDNSKPHYFIKGDGSLTLEGGGILARDGCNLSFGDGTDEIPTINAEYLHAFDNEGEVWFNRCQMNLTGGDGYTIGRFADIHTVSGTSINYPEGATYDNSGRYDDYCLTNADGAWVKGEVHIGGEGYGLKICGEEVTSFNKDRILGEDNLTFDPSTRTLHLKGARLYSTSDSCIVNTGGNLIIKCDEDSYIGTKDAPAIYSTHSLEFQGPLTIGTEGAAIQMDASDQYIKFKNSNVDINAVGYTIYAQPENHYRLYVDNSDLILRGEARGISFYELTNVGISTEGVYIQPANAQFPDGGFCLAGEQYRGNVIFKRATADYGIIVSGHRLNDVNANNFYFDDITSGTVSYNADKGKLTLTDVTAQCSRLSYVNGKVVQTHTNGINITSSAPARNYYRIILKGENTFNNIEGMGMAIFKDAIIHGEGTLNLGTKSIGSYNGARIQVFFCTVNAGRVVGSGYPSHLMVNDANMHLTGGISGQSAITKFDNVDFVDCTITKPASCIYDPDRANLVVDESIYTGAVVITANSALVSVEDITSLIDEYLEPDSDITVEDITNLIDRYLEQ